MEAIELAEERSQLRVVGGLRDANYDRHGNRLSV